MKRATFAAFVLAALAASCASSPRPEPLPRVEPAPPAPVVVVPEPPRDQCGAQALQHLVGKPRTEIPVPVEIDNRRVTCTTCPITEEYGPKRLNIFFDANTGLVKEVRCG